MTSAYVPLTTIIADFARQSGELEATILRHLCKQDEIGRFPSKTFAINGTGDLASWGSLHQIVRACQGGFEVVRWEARTALTHIVCHKQSIRDFCARMGVRPPKSVASQWERFQQRNALPCPPGYPHFNHEFVEYDSKVLSAYKKQAEHYESETADKAQGYLDACEQLVLTRQNELEYSYTVQESDRYFSEFIRSAEEALAEIEGTETSTPARVRLGELQQAYDRDCTRLPRDAHLTMDSSSGHKTAQVRVRKSSNQDIRQAKAYLQREAEKGNKLPKTRHHEQCCAEVGRRLSWKAWENAWADSVPNEWKKAGRPCKRE